MINTQLYRLGKWAMYVPRHMYFLIELIKNNKFTLDNDEDAYWRLQIIMSVKHDSLIIIVAVT